MTNKLSLFALALGCAMMFYCGYFFHPTWKQPGSNATLSWDAAGYYWYLPSIFIYKDLRRQEFKDEIINKYKPDNGGFQQAMMVNGNYILKYSCGMALMYLPFFLTANMLAKPLHYPQDGFSPPYQFAIQTGALLVSFLGLWIFRKILLKFYDDNVAAMSLVVLVFGTNYLDYSAIDNSLSHTWLFTVYALLILTTINYYERPTAKKAILTGILVGLATLTRPSEIISCLIPLLWGIRDLSIASLRKHLIFLKNNFTHLAIALVCAAGVFSIQIVYWRHVSGMWLVYSYGDQGFSFLSPHFHEYIFSYATGWLTYTPMMFLAFVGILPLVRKSRHWVAITGFFFINLYIVSSWDAFYFGGRAMVQSYSILMLPIAELINTAIKNRIGRAALAPFVILFLYMNLWWTYNAHAGEGLLDENVMSSRYFWRIAGRWHKPADIDKLKDTNEWFEGERHNMHLIHGNDYTDTARITNDTIIDGRHALYIGSPSHNPSSGWESFAYSGKNADWLNLEATFTGTKESNTWLMRQFMVRFINKGEVIKERMIRLDRFMPTKGTATISFDTKIPNRPFDSVGISFWNESSKETLIIDSLHVSSFTAR